MKTAPVGVSHSSVCLLFARLTTLLLVIMLCGCGGGTSSAPPPPPPPPHPPPPAFQPRPFPGDFFMRLPTAVVDGPVPAAAYDQALKRSEEHTSELQSLTNLVCRLLLEKKKQQNIQTAEYHDITYGKPSIYISRSS